MGKMIIKNDSRLTDNNALIYVSDVISKGRISNDGKCYCLATTYIEGVVVTCRVSRNGTDIIRVSDNADQS